MKVKTIKNDSPVKRTELEADTVYVTNDQGDKLRVTTRSNGEFIISIPVGYAIVLAPASVELVRYMD